MAKYLPHGTIFTINAKAVGGLISVGIPDRTRGDAETTDSAASFNRTFLPGLRDGGSVSLTFRHDIADLGQLELEANYNLDASAALKTCTIVLPAPASRTYTFTGFVTEPPKGDIGLVDDDVAQQTSTVRITGSVTIT